MTTHFVSSTDSHVRAAIAQLMEEANRLAQSDGRHEARLPFFHPITVAPDSGHPPISGITRQVSPSGIGMLHCVPLITGPARVTLQDSLGFGVTLPIEVTWCRSCGPHWYLSGGRLMTTAEPIEELPDGVELFSDIVKSIRRTIATVACRSEENDYANRRSEERYYANLPVTAELETNRTANRVWMVTRDLSKNGIALMSDQELPAKLLKLEISDIRGDKTLTALMQVLRCRPIGHIYEVGGKIVSKVSSE